MAGKKTNKRRRARRRFAALTLIVCVGAAAYLGAKGVSELRDRKAGSDYYAQLAETVEGAEGEFTLSAEPTPDAADASSAGRETAEKQEPTGGDAASRGSAIDFDALRQTCPDAVGWIRVEDTVIDYPIVRGEDNVYYLHHLADGTANSSGAIMMDCACDGAFGSMVTILHGHHMRSGAMFGDLDEFADEDYYRAHSGVRLYTPDGDYDVEIFAACTVNGRTFGYPTDFTDAEAFDDFVAELKAGTGYDTGVEVVFGDRILLLSTCAYSFETARFVLAGKIVE